MNNEIELKLLFSPQDYDFLIEKLDNFTGCHRQQGVESLNRYFDTENLQLARWDMGLRIRNEQNTTEQTIKTTGTVINGVHSRPEYNVLTAQKTPDLSLFPKSIWPEGVDVAQVQSQLTPLFNTNFHRQTWLYKTPSAQIEIVVDKGTISPCKEDAPLSSSLSQISEIEFELIDGDIAQLYECAAALAKLVPLRLAQQSKALRGYLLYTSAKTHHDLPAKLQQTQSAVKLFLRSVYSQDLTIQEHLKTLAQGIDIWCQLETLYRELVDEPTSPEGITYSDFNSQLCQLLSALAKSAHTIELSQSNDQLGLALSNELIEQLNGLTTAPWEDLRYGQLQLHFARVGLPR